MTPMDRLKPSSPEDAVISDELNHASIIDGAACARFPAIVIEITICLTSRPSSRKRDAGARRRPDYHRRGFPWTAPSLSWMIVWPMPMAPWCTTMTAATGFMGDQGRGVHEYRRPCRHHHGHASALVGVLGDSPQAGGNYRHSPPALPALPFLQHAGARHCAASLKVLDMLEASTFATTSRQYPLLVNKCRRMTCCAEGDHPLCP